MILWLIPSNRMAEMPATAGPAPACGSAQVEKALYISTHIGKELLNAVSHVLKLACFGGKPVNGVFPKQKLVSYLILRKRYVRGHQVVVQHVKCMRTLPRGA